MEWLEVFKPVVAGAASGGVAAFLGFRSWVKRVDRKTIQVDNHESRLTTVEQGIESLRRDFHDHTSRQEASLSTLTTGVQKLVGDIGYVRGWIDGQKKAEE